MLFPLTRIHYSYINSTRNAAQPWCEAGREAQGRRGEDKGDTNVRGWMRGGKRAVQCSDAQQFGEKLIFLVLGAHIQAGLLEQHIQPRSPRVRQRTRDTGGGGGHSTTAYCRYDTPRHCTSIC